MRPNPPSKAPTQDRVLTAEERMQSILGVDDADPDLARAMVNELRRELEASRRQSAANALVVTRAVSRITELERENAAMSQRISDLTAAGEPAFDPSALDSGDPDAPE